MSSRTTLRPHQVITNGSMASDITSQPTILQSLTGASYSLSWSGTSPLGVVSVETSNDYSLNPDGTVNNAGTWNPIELSLGGTAVTSIPVSGSTGKGFIDIQKINGYAIRLFYDRTSGVGTLNSVIVGKVS